MRDNPWEPEIIVEYDDVLTEGEDYKVVVQRTVEKTSYTISGNRVPFPVHLAAHKAERFQKLGPNYTIHIDPRTAEKLNWEIGSELYIDIFDEDLKQAIIGRKLQGKEIRKGLGKLQERVTEKIA